MPLELKQLMLAEPRLTLGIAESMTCGWLQARVGAISGASEFLRGGITAYALEEKVRHLGVDCVHAAAVNAVSVGVAEQMARGACQMFGSDIGLATTGYAERCPSMRVDEPFAFWALAYCRPGEIPVVVSGRIECPGKSRVESQRLVSDAVLGQLVRFLVNIRS